MSAKKKETHTTAADKKPATENAKTKPPTVEITKEDMFPEELNKHLLYQITVGLFNQKNCSITTPTSVPNFFQNVGLVDGTFLSMVHEKPSESHSSRVGTLLMRVVNPTAISQVNKAPPMLGLADTDIPVAREIY